MPLLPRGSRVLPGATLAGQDLAELPRAPAVAAAGGVPLGRLRHAVTAGLNPGEVWLRLLGEYGQ